MTTAYTGLLGLALPVTGELSGTWGDTVNNYITQYVDAAVAGTQVISGSQTAVTLSTTNGLALSQAGGSGTGSAQYAVINCTGNPPSLLTITAPATSKTYIVINDTSTSQSVKLVGAGPTTGVTLVSGERSVIAWNGADFIKVVSSVTGTVTNVTASSPLASSGGTAPNISFTGTLAVANGGTGLTATPTSGQIDIGNGSGFTRTTLTAGSGVSITNGSGSITIAATGSGGTVTSVGLSVPSFLSVSNSPVTGSGTIAVSYSGTALPVANGGTGATSASITAFNNITGYTASGATGTTSTNIVFSTSPALTTPTFTGAKEVQVAIAASNIDLNLANYFSRTISGTTTFTVSNVPASGTAASFILDLTNGGSATINWWANVKWPGGTAPTLTASGRDVLGFFTYNGGTTWTGLLLGRDVK